MSNAAALNEHGGTAPGRDSDDDVAEITGFLNVQHARLIRTVERVLATGEWSAHGIHTPAQWLAVRAGLSPERAAIVIGVAERLPSFPKVGAAFDAGRFTLDQVVEITKAPPWADEKVLDFASIATVTQLRRTMRDECFTGDPDEPAKPPAKPESKDRLSFGPAGDHRWRIRGELDLDAGRRVEAALSEKKDALFERGDSDATWADALTEMAEASLDSVVSPTRRDRHRSWLHLDVTDGTATTTDGWRIPMAVRDRLLCDGVVQPVWERDGVPFALGHSQRVVSDRLRRVIERRDRGCQVPGCTNSRYVEVHHIIHWLNGGATDSWNLIMLCTKHHRAHHRGEIGIAGNADEVHGVTFTDWAGRRLGPTDKPVIPNRDPDPPDTPYEPPIGGRMDYKWVGGSRVHPKELARRRATARAKWTSKASGRPEASPPT